MTLQRDRVFWTVGFQVAIINIYLGGFGPAQPLLRAQQHTSLTVAGLHGTSMGIAAILAGFVNPHLTHRFGRQITSWIGFAFFCFGVLMFVLCPPVQLTLLATLIGGFGVSTIINTMVTQLSDHFPNDASDAVSQASGISSGGYIIGTLSVGAIASTTLSWRLGLLSVIPLSLLLYFYARPHISKEHVPHEDGPERGAMSVKFWIAWIGFIACISTEFGTTFWAAALVQDRVGSTPAISTLSMLAFGIGMAMGRWYGPHVLRRFSLDSQLKTVLVFQFCGFGIFWSSHVMWVSLITLLMVGIGVSMQFALNSMRLIGLSGGRPDLAIGRSSLAAGIAIAASPFLLGVFGDQFGISRAYLMVPVLILIGLGTIITIPTHSADKELSR